MIRGIVFDHDGTLVDSEKQHYRAWHSLLADRGHHFPERDYIEHYTGLPTVSSASRLVAYYGLPLSGEQLCREKERLLDADRELPPLMPGARELLQRLSQQAVPLAVATGARSLEVGRNLAGHGLRPLFRSVCTCDRVAANKPAPDVYLLAARELNLPPEQCLAVEDTPTGMRSALAAGMPCAVVTEAYPNSHDFSAATYRLANLSDLADWLFDDILQPL